MSADAATAAIVPIRVTTEHATAEAFIAVFCKYCDRSSFFLPTTQSPPPVGVEIEFQVALSTGERVLRGIGTVNAVFPTVENPWGASGVHLLIKKMTTASSEMFAKLRAARGNTASMTLLGIPVITKPPAAIGTDDAVPVALPPRVRTATGPIPLPIPVTPATQTQPLRRVSTIAPWEPPLTGRIPTQPNPAIPRTRTHVGTGTTPPPQVRARRPSMEPIIGERTPGSPHILPANPLAEMSDDGISAFIDSATFLTEGSEGEPQKPPKPEASAAAAEPAPLPAAPTRAPTPLPIRVPSVVPPQAVAPKRAPTPAPIAAVAPKRAPSPVSVVDAIPIEVPVAKPEPKQGPSPVSVVDAIPIEVAAAEPMTKRAPTPAPVAAVPPPVKRAPTPLPSSLVPNENPTPIPTLLPAKPIESAEAVAAPRPRRTSRKVAAIGATLITIAIVGIGIAMIDREEATRVEATEPPTSNTPPVAPVEPAAVVEPTPTPVEPEPEPEPEPVEPMPPEAAPTEPCTIVVASRPSGAAVHFDGKPAGRTPLTIPTSCKKHRVTLSRAGFESDLRWVAPSAKKPTASVEIALRRPRHALTVSTKPGGATVFVDGKRAGVTPVTVDVPGFVPSTVKIIKPGHAIVTRKIVSRKKTDKLSVFLQRE
jgi:hypothetical protein